MGPIEELRAEIKRQDAIHTAGFRPPLRNQVRLGLAAIEDETAEAYEAWVNEKRLHKEMLNNDEQIPWDLTATEVLHTAAVAMRLYIDIKNGVKQSTLVEAQNGSRQ